MAYAARRALADKAMHEAIRVRSMANLGYDGPLDIFDLSQKLGLRVRFVGISMEGMYKRGHPPRIFLSALRPQARRVFTCAHEIGHHVFRHGSTIDDLVEDSAKAGSFMPQEVLAQSFAGHLLMPVFGIRRALIDRGWQASELTPQQPLTIASQFGVGYTTLVNHLAYALQTISASQARELLRAPLPSIRRNLVGKALSAHLIVVDQHWSLPTIDAEVGTHILLPSKTLVTGDLLALSEETEHGRLYAAVKPGIVRIERPCSRWAAFVRVSRFQYVGLSEYRHLEEINDDDEEGDVE